MLAVTDLPVHKIQQMITFRNPYYKNRSLQRNVFETKGLGSLKV